MLKMKAIHLPKCLVIKLNSHYTSDSSEDNRHTRKMKYKPYEEISGEFKKIKLPTFNGET